VRQPTDAEVAQERLGGDVGERDVVVEPGLAELVGGVEEELVRRPEAAGAPWVAAMTTSPGLSRNFCQASAVRSASASVVMVTAFSAKPGTTSVWLR
jgi:hypothetical protein